MQSINITAVRPALMTALFGTGAACAMLALSDGQRSPLVVTGSALYLVGAIGVTLVGNVPLNNALAALDPDGGDTDRAWRHYVRRWSRFNHLRTLSCLAASAAFLTALAQN